MAKPRKPKRGVTSEVDSIGIAANVEEQRLYYGNQRKRFERIWYNNNFFDDGLHFQFVSRQTGKIVDISKQGHNRGVPHRAIPRASRQIRGIANLLLQPEYVPVIYPRRIPDNIDPEQYQQLEQIYSQEARKKGWFVEDRWRELKLKQLLTEMMVKAAKHSISWIQVWWDDELEDINTKVYDGFDIYCMSGNIRNPYQSPSLIKSVPMLLEDILSDDRFDEERRESVIADNRYASSEIKESYLRSRFGTERQPEDQSTVILDEAYIKERLNSENWSRAKKNADETGAMEGKSRGDMIIRQIFGAGKSTLKDTYTNLAEYPFASYRMEPGSIYQTSLMERFIPANKSLDMVMSRVEHWIGTQAVGIWLKRKGENYEISNIPGGQEIEYESTPPQQMQISTMPGVIMQFVDHLNTIIDEQGATTAGFGELPPGVKSGVAIESIKSAEYASLKMASDMLKDTVYDISMRMLEAYDLHMDVPRPVQRMDEEERFSSFDVIGASNLNRYQEIQKKSMGSNQVNAVPISQNEKLRIEVHSGLGFTMEGKISRLQQISEFMRVLAQEGYVTQEQVQDFTRSFLDIFQYGSTSEFFKKGQEGTPPFTVKQLEMVKVAVAEVIRDLQKASAPARQQAAQANGQAQQQQAASGDEQDIQKIKVGVAEAIRDIKNASAGAGQTGQ